ncbi:methyl-accepting chemotaxis protein [Thiobacter aerophilum]|uniref:Methyl-accepting chemotaxis protein n=1 Tax=Thiobacter aerophilum TaxID=3121275 RepID=A0ABV0EEN4_9BURK
MSLLNQLSIRSKLTLLVASSSLIMLAVGITGLWGLHAANRVAESIYKERLVAINQLNTIRHYQMQNRMELLAARLEQDAFEIMAHADKVRSNMYKVQQLVNAYAARKPAGEEGRLFTALLKARRAFSDEGLLPLIDLLQAEKFAEADRLRKNTMDALFDTQAAAIDALIDHQTRAAERDFARAQARARVVDGIAIGAIVVGVLLSTLWGLLLTRSVNRGVARLEQAAARLAQGDLTTRVHAEAHDEIGAVAQSFNRMTDQFAGIVREVSEASHSVDNTAERLSHVAEQVTTRSRSQSREAAEAAAAIEDLNRAFQEIAATAERIEAAAAEARALAERGNGVVTTAVKGIQDVAQTVSESAQMIAQLGERSSQIGQILAVIKDIADQTNLLALNAAIEAARAGEQGRGFAVVADEVRKLAERTANATNEISAMIEAIQSETARAVATMEKGSQQVAEGVSHANLAGQALSDINRSVADAVRRIHDIAVATRGRTGQSEALAAQVERIAAMAESNRAALEDTSQAVHALLAQAHNLEQVVKRFRLAA